MHKILHKVKTLPLHEKITGAVIFTIAFIMIASLSQLDTVDTQINNAIAEDIALQELELSQLCRDIKKNIAIDMNVYDLEDLREDCQQL